MPVHRLAAQQFGDHFAGDGAVYFGNRRHALVAEARQVGVVGFCHLLGGVAVAVVVKLADFLGFFRVHAEDFQRGAPGADGGVEGFADDGARARVVEFVHVDAVVGAGDDGQVRVGAAHVFGDGNCLFALVDGDNQQFGFGDACGFQKRRLAGVAEVAFHAEARQTFDGFDVVVNHGGVVAAAEEEVVHQLADAAVSQNDDGVFFGDDVCFALEAVAAGTRRQQFVVSDKEERRQQHGEGDDEQQAFGGVFRHVAMLYGEGEEDETEFARLRQRQGKERQAGAAQAEDFAEYVQHRRLDCHDSDGQGEDDVVFVAQQLKVDARADGDEEQAEQEAFERLQRAFQFVAVFTVRQYHAGDEGAKRGREADEAHQRGDADDEHQGGCGIDFAHARAGDVAQEGMREVVEGGDEADDDGKDGGRLDVAGQSFKQRRFMATRAVRRRRQLRQGNQRQERQHRDDGNILKEQHGKARLTAGAVQKAFFAQRLQDDCGGGERQYATGGYRHLPRLAEDEGEDGNGGDGAQHLQAAQPQ